MEERSPGNRAPLFFFLCYNYIMSTSSNTGSVKLTAPDPPVQASRAIVLVPTKTDVDTEFHLPGQHDQSTQIRLLPKDLSHTIDSKEVEEFHLPGKHDQSSHGRPQGGGQKGDDESRGARKEGERRPTIHRSQVAPTHGIPVAGKFTGEQEKAIRDFGHKPEDYDAKGKPIPGTDSWRDAHGISKEVYDARPMKRWANSQDPVFDEVYKDFEDPKLKSFGKKVAGQSSGFVMVRKGTPEAEKLFGAIPPQARPDTAIITDGRKKARKERELRGAIARKEKVDKWTSGDVIAERKQKVAEAKALVKETKTSSGQDIRDKAENNLTKTRANLRKAEKSGDPDRIADAKVQHEIAKYHLKDEKKRAFLLDNDPQRAVALADQNLRNRERGLATALAKPEQTLHNVQASAGRQVIKKEQQVKDVAVKYVFPKGEGNAARIEVNQDRQNVKNLIGGKGRVYFIMEGNLKADAALTRVKKEDPAAAVMSVPSVTTWANKHDEVGWYADKYLKGRDVVLIPDADGVTNKDVVSQAKQLAGKLRSSGVDNVTIAAPPLERGKRGKLSVEELSYPTGAKDHRKGLDDHLGLGKGTLGDLVYSDTPPPKFNLSEFNGKDIPRGTRIRRQAIPNAEKTLGALSDMAGDSGTGRISQKAIEQYSGLPSTSVKDSLKRLETSGIIQRHDIFDPKLLGHGRRVPAMEFDEIKRVAKKAGIKIPDLDLQFVTDDNKHETAPIFEIIRPKYITNQGGGKTLASKYKSLKTSPKAPKPRPSTASASGRIVRSAEGARRYNVPIGSPIPEVQASTTGTITLGVKPKNSETVPETATGTIHLGIKGLN